MKNKAKSVDKFWVSLLDYLQLTGLKIWVFIASGGILTWMFGSWDEKMIALVWLMALDFLTGWAAALVLAKEGKGAGLSSSRSIVGAIRKTLILLLISAIYHTSTAFEIGAAVRNLVVFGFLVSEFISIVENVAKVLPVPPVVYTILAVFKNRVDVATRDFAGGPPEKEDKHEVQR